MKVIVAGSREITDYHTVRDAIDASPFAPRVSEIVSGTARGVDQLGIDYAVTNYLSWTEFPANWQQYGQSAGFRRNEDMADYADALVAIRLSGSRGTTHMIEAMRKRGKPYFVVDILRDEDGGFRVREWSSDDPEPAAQPGDSGVAHD